MSDEMVCPFCGHANIGRDFHEDDPCDYLCKACGEAFNWEDVHEL